MQRHRTFEFVTKTQFLSLQVLTPIILVILFPLTTHNEWDCKYDLKLLKYEDFKAALYSFSGLFNDLRQRKNNFIVAKNHEYRKTHKIIPYSRLWSLILCWLSLMYTIFLNPCGPTLLPPCPNISHGMVLISVKPVSKVSLGLRVGSVWARSRVKFNYISRNFSPSHTHRYRVSQ